jgi:hypothetical protein
MRNRIIATQMNMKIKKAKYLNTLDYYLRYVNAKTNALQAILELVQISYPPKTKMRVYK